MALFVFLRFPLESTIPERCYSGVLLWKSSCCCTYSVPAKGLVAPFNQRNSWANVWSFNDTCHALPCHLCAEALMRRTQCPWQQFLGSSLEAELSTLVQLQALAFFTPRRFSWSSSWHWFLESILWKIMASSLKSCGFFPPIWKAFPCCLSNQAQKMSCIKAEDQLFKDDMAWCWCRLIDDSCGLLWGISTATGAFCHRVIECKGCCVSCIIYHLSPATKSHEATQGRGQQMPVGFCLCLRNGWLPDGLWSQLGAPFLLQTLWAGCEQHDFGFSWNCLVLRLAESAVPRTLGLLWHACFMLLALDSIRQRLHKRWSRCSLVSFTVMLGFRVSDTEVPSSCLSLAEVFFCDYLTFRVMGVSMLAPCL